MTPAAFPPALAQRPPRERATQIELAVVSDAAQARSLLDPARRAILATLREPGSSSTVAQALGLPRQRVNYHVRELEKEGLLHHIENRRRGNCVERIVRASARRHLIDPGIPDEAPPLPSPADPADDPFASATLKRLAVRTLDEVRQLEDRAAIDGKRPPTLSVEAQIHFASPAREVEFAREMRRLIDEVAARYHDPGAPGGRDFRIALTGYLIPEAPSDAPGDDEGGEE